MYAPGVSKTGAPPAAGTEYRCGQSSKYAMKTRRLPAAQCRLAPPATSGKEPASEFGLFHTACPVPSPAEATQIDQGRGSRVRIGRGAPPSPAPPVYALRVPSAAHI